MATTPGQGGKQRAHSWLTGAGTGWRFRAERAGLAGRTIDESVGLGLVRPHEKITVSVLRDLVQRLPRELGEVPVEGRLVVHDLVSLRRERGGGEMSVASGGAKGGKRLKGSEGQDLASSPTVRAFARLDLNVRGLPLSTTERLVDHDAAVRQAETLPLGPGSKKECPCGFARHAGSTHDERMQAVCTIRERWTARWSGTESAEARANRGDEPMDAARPTQTVLQAGRIWRIVSKTAMPAQWTGHVATD